MYERTLLIVDDNVAVCTALHAYLSRVAGWSSVLTAQDAAVALDLAAERSPQAIVLDNRMPGTHGIDILAELRATCPGAVIVMHTSDDSTDLRTTAQRLGADAVVSKGRPLDELAALLRVA